MSGYYGKMIYVSSQCNAQLFNPAAGNCINYNARSGAHEMGIWRNNGVPGVSYNGGLMAARQDALAQVTAYAAQNNLDVQSHNYQEEMFYYT